MYKFMKILNIYTYPMKQCTNGNIRQPTKERKQQDPHIYWGRE